jgi:hypothetical protein
VRGTWKPDAHIIAYACLMLAETRSASSSSTGSTAIICTGWTTDSEAGAGVDSSSMAWKTAFIANARLRPTNRRVLRVMAKRITSDCDAARTRAALRAWNASSPSSRTPFTGIIRSSASVLLNMPYRPVSTSSKSDGFASLAQVTNMRQPRAYTKTTLTLVACVRAGQAAAQ